MSLFPMPIRHSPPAWPQLAARPLLAAGALLTLGLSPPTLAESTPRALQIHGAKASQMEMLKRLQEADVILLGEL